MRSQEGQREQTNLLEIAIPRTGRLKLMQRGLRLNCRGSDRTFQRGGEEECQHWNEASKCWELRH